MARRSDRIQTYTSSNAAAGSMISSEVRRCSRANVSASVFASPSTRDGFGLTYVEAMATDCTVIAADHPDSAANEVIGDAGFCVDRTVDVLTETLGVALIGTCPPTSPVEHAQQYD